MVTNDDVCLLENLWSYHGWTVVTLVNVNNLFVSHFVLESVDVVVEHYGLLGC